MKVTLAIVLVLCLAMTMAFRANNKSKAKVRQTIDDFCPDSSNPCWPLSECAAMHIYCTNPSCYGLDPGDCEQFFVGGGCSYCYDPDTYFYCFN